MSEVTDIQTVKILERIAVSLEARVVAPTKDMTDLVDYLHAEIATLKALNAGQHAENARMASRHREQLAEGGAVNARLTEDRDAAWRTVTALQEQIARTTEERDVLRAEVAVHRAASAEANDALREVAELRAENAAQRQELVMLRPRPPEKK